MSHATSASPRIAPLEPPFETEIGALLAKMTPPGTPDVLALFRTLAVNPKLAERMTGTGGYFLGRHATLPLRDREIVIDRVCARCGNEYEWGVHVAAFAKAAGLTDAEVRATVTWPSDETAWPERDALLIEMVDALHEDAAVPDALWGKLAALYSEAQLLELLMLAGWYHAISFVCNAARVPLETWQARLPKAL